MAEGPAVGDGARQPHLDGLRGVAAASVVFSHFLCAFYHAFYSGDPAQHHLPGDLSLCRTGIILFFNPDLDVAIFFTLSGYVLAAGMAQGGLSLAGLVVRRWVRLCVPAILVCLAAWLAIRAGLIGNTAANGGLTHSPWLAALYPEPAMHVRLWSLPKNFLLTFFTGDAGSSGRLDPPIWTLSIEFLGSILLLSLYRLRLFAEAPAVARLLTAAGLAALFWHTQLYGFGTGILLYELGRTLAGRAKPAAVAGCGLAVLAAGLWLGSTPYVMGAPYLRFSEAFYNYGVPFDGPDMHHAGAALLLAAVLLLAPLRRALARPGCRFLGRISYMLYLVHVPVLACLGLPVFRAALRLLPYNAAAAVTLVAFAAASVLGAWGLSRAVDAPAIAASRRLGLAVPRLRLPRRRHRLRPLPA